MAYTKTTITGTVDLPNGDTPTNGHIVFQLVQWDKDGGNLFVPGPVIAPIADNGTISVDLQNTDALDRQSLYAVRVVYYAGFQRKEVPLSNIYVPASSGNVLLADLLQFPAPLPDTPDLLEQVQRALAQALAAQAAAEAAVGAAGDQAMVDYIRATVAALPTAAQGAFLNQNAFVTGTGNFYHFNGTSWVDDGPGPLSQFLKTATFNDVVLRNFYAVLTNVTYDAAANRYTASLPANYPSNFTELGGAQMEITFPVTNAVAGARLTVAGFDRELGDSSNNNLSMGYIVPGVPYRFGKVSNGRWNTKFRQVRQSQLTAIESKATATDGRVTELEMDMADHDTVRSAIPMVLAQAAYGAKLVATPLRTTWPKGSTTYIYSGTVPLGKPRGQQLIIAQDGRDRAMANSTEALEPGDPIVWKLTGSNSGEFLYTFLTPARLTALSQARRNGVLRVTQKSRAWEPRPTTDASIPVEWYGFERPPAGYMQLDDSFLQRPDPIPPGAPDSRTFYLKPTLNSLETSVVVNGIDMQAYRPILEGETLFIGQDQIELGGAMPNERVLDYDWKAGQEYLIQLAVSNYVGRGTPTPVKRYTPVSSPVFARSFINTSTVSGSGALIGRSGFKNNYLTTGVPVMGASGLGPSSPNDTMYVQTDVGGLSGRYIYAQQKINRAFSAAGSTPIVGLGLNNAWLPPSSRLDTDIRPTGIFFFIQNDRWRLQYRLGTATTTLREATMADTFTSMRVERRNNIFHGFIDGNEVLTYDMNLLDLSALDETEGVVIYNYRPSGGQSKYYLSYDFEAGLLVA